jgi:hypothetical protein
MSLRIYLFKRISFSYVIQKSFEATELNACSEQLFYFTHPSALNLNSTENFLVLFSPYNQDDNVFGIASDYGLDYSEFESR